MNYNNSSFVAILDRGRPLISDEIDYYIVITLLFSLVIFFMVIRYFISHMYVYQN